MSHDLVHAAKEAGISDASLPDLSPELVLLEWTKRVGRDYKDRLRASCVEAMGKDQGIGGLYAMLAEMAMDVKEIKGEKQDMVLEIAGLKANLSVKCNQNSALEAELKNIKSNLTVVEQKYVAYKGKYAAARNEVEYCHRWIVLS